MNNEQLVNHIASTIFIRAVRNSLQELTDEQKADIADRAFLDAHIFMSAKRANDEKTDSEQAYSRAFIGKA